MLSKLSKLAHLREIHVEVDKSYKSTKDDDDEFNAVLLNIIRNVARMMEKHRYY